MVFNLDSRLRGWVCELGLGRFPGLLPVPVAHGLEMPDPGRGDYLRHLVARTLPA